MQLADALFASGKGAEDEAVDGGDAGIEDVIDHVHPMHPVLVYASIPKELHHDEELGQLRYLCEDYQADGQAKRDLITL